MVQKLTKIGKKWWAHTFKRLISTFEVVATELLFGLGGNGTVFFYSIEWFASELLFGLAEEVASELLFGLGVN